MKNPVKVIYERLDGIEVELLIEPGEIWHDDLNETWRLDAFVENGNKVTLELLKVNFNPIAVEDLYTGPPIIAEHFEEETEEDPDKKVKNFAIACLVICSIILILVMINVWRMI
jgi:hypothetical protein